MPNDPVGQTMTMHAIGCPALLAWDEIGACTCGGRRVTILRRLDAEPDPHPWANLPPEMIAPVHRCVGGCDQRVSGPDMICASCEMPR